MAQVPPLRIGGGGNARSAPVQSNVPRESLDIRGPQAVVGALQEWVKRDEAARDNLISVKVQEEFKRQSLDAISQLDPLDSGYTEKLKTSLTDIQAGLLSDTGITNRKVAEDLQFRLTAALEADVTTASVTRRTAIAKDAVQTWQDLADLTLAQIRDAPDGVRQQVDAFADQVKRLNTGIPAEVSNSMTRTFAEAAFTAQVEGLALHARFDEAKALLAKEGGILDPEANRTLGRRIREIENQTQSELSSAINRQVANLEIQISDAPDEGALAKARLEVEKMDKEGKFTNERESTRANLIQAINSRRRSLVSDGRKLADALNAYERGTLSNQSDVDMVYAYDRARLQEENGGEPLSTEQALDHLVSFSKKSGRLPSEQNAYLENAGVSNDPERLASAAVMYKRLAEGAPAVKTDAGPQVELTYSLMRLNDLDAVSAAQRVIEQGPNNAAIKQRDEEFALLAAEFDAKAFVNREVLGRGLINRIFTSEVQVGPEVERDTRDTYAMFYRLSGDEAAAKASTAMVMRRKYGKTSVGRSQPEVVKYPPEKNYFPAPVAQAMAEDPDLANRLIFEDVEGAIAAVIGRKPPGAAPKAPVFPESPEGADIPGDIEGEGALNIPDGPAGLDLPAFVLQTTEKTERAIREGEPARWNALIRDEFGGYAPLWVDTPTGLRQFEIVAPTMEELTAMPAWQERIAEQQKAAELRQELDRMFLQGGHRFGGQRFGGQRFGGQRFGGQRFGGDRFGASASDAILGDTQEPVLPPVEPEAVSEPDEVTGSLFGGLISSAAAAELKVPPGLKNMNPGNIRHSDTVWEGQAAKGAQTDENFVTFSSPRYGIRAIARILRNYERLYGRNTVESMISRWAPRKGKDAKGREYTNPTDAYIKNVAKWMGVDPNQRLNLQDPMIMRSLIKSIIRQENGLQPYSDDLIDEGIALEKEKH